MNSDQDYPSPLRIIGVMSGSSLDGLDLAFCQFSPHSSGWAFTILQAETIAYPPSWHRRLSGISGLMAKNMAQLDTDLGEFIGQSIVSFVSKHTLKDVHYIASHGHTALHNPSGGFSLQIGHGATIAARTGIPVIVDFRSLDVALGGQGAPLVPIGDELLFSQYDYCLNLGGFSNISYRQGEKRIAYDICPVNKAINLLTRQSGKEMDLNGSIASQGEVDKSLLRNLNKVDYYRLPAPKSLGDQWFNSRFMPVIHQRNDLSLKDKLRTLYEHIAQQIASSTSRVPDGKMLVTGGGAHNTFLMELIRQNSKTQIIKPSNLLVDYKEALVFALMGGLRSINQINCLASATGASRNSSTGVIYQI